MLKIIRDDLLNVKAKAIVNPTDIFLSGSGSIDKKIHKAGGIGLKKQLSMIPNTKVSEAIITKAYDYKNSDYIIHVAGPMYIDGFHNETESLRQTYRNILSISKQNSIDSLAIPLISTGTFNYPKKIAYTIAIEEINEFLIDNDIDITLVVYDEQSFIVSKQLSDNVQNYIDNNYVKKEISILSNNYLFRKKHNKFKVDQNTSYLQTDEENILVSGACYPSFKNETLPQFELDESFSEALLRIIDEKGLKDPQVYKKAGIDRKLFSTIRSNKDYHPSKKTAISLCIALELDIYETEWLLKKAGLALSDSNLFDVIVEYFIKNNNYDTYEINVVLLDNDQPLICI